MICLYKQLQLIDNIQCYAYIIIFVVIFIFLFLNEQQHHHQQAMNIHNIVKEMLEAKQSLF